MRKGLKFFILILLTISCAQPKPYQYTGKFKHMEEMDHAQCMPFHGNSHDIEVDKELYWRCRVKEINFRINRNVKHEGDSEGTKELQKVKRILNNRVIQAQNANTAKSQRNIQEIDHQICVARYYMNIQDSSQYNTCRNKLLEERTPPEPFSHKSYHLGKNERKNIELLDDLIKNLSQRSEKPGLNELADQMTDLIIKFPTCQKHKSKIENFKLCIEAQQKAQYCHQQIPEKEEVRKLQDKMFCKKQAAEKAPDSLVLYSKEKTKKDETTNNMDIGPKFSRNEIITLRKKIQKKCLRRRKEKFREYIDFLPTECETMSKDWKKAEAK